MLEQFDLTDAATRAVKTYSGGMRRRLDLAASLIGYPSVLFLDEPTTGLDPNARAMTWDIVRELVADGTTLLLTTQYLEEADQLASRVAVIDGGKVIAEGTPDQLKASVGGAHLDVVLAAGSDLEAAIAAIKPTPPARPAGPRRAAPVRSGGRGRRADHARGARPGRGRSQGQRRDDSRASLDDVFLALTGHAAAPAKPRPQEDQEDRTQHRDRRRKGVRPHERHHRGPGAPAGRHLRAQPVRSCSSPTSGC
jgi:ABC-type multidrug transport system ATPase subunit